jgi:isopenicillin N synthase-like dioxygenase
MGIKRRRAMDQTIPVLDMSDFRAGYPHGGWTAAEKGFAEAVGSALADLGFFAVTNHGVDPSLIRRSYAAATAFFELPEPVKRRYEDLGLKGQRGFTSFGREHAKDHPAPDLKEFWHVGRDLPSGHRFASEYPQNIWPEEVPDFRPALSELYRQLDGCAAVLLESAALYLGEPRSLISDMTREGNTVLRISHYPPIPPDASPASLRAAPHEDINLITLLCEATASGLEIQARDGRWLPVQALPGQIIVDAGDMLQNLTNGLLKSTTHRVTNPDNTRERRLSMPFFVHPRSEVSLAPLAGCVARTGGVKQYPDITAGAYLEQRLREIGLA